MTEKLSLFHLSPVCRDGQVLKPRVPANAMTGEDQVTPRICFARTVWGAAMAVSDAGRYYVHVPVGYRGTMVADLEGRVPDAALTGEVWLTDPVRLHCIGTIEVCAVWRDQVWTNEETEPVEVRVQSRLMPGIRLTLFTHVVDKVVDSMFADALHAEGPWRDLLRHADPPGRGRLHRYGAA